MKSKYDVRLIGLCLLAAAACTGLSPMSGLAIEAPESQPISGKIKWVYDYNEGKRLSKETGKPMFVVFRCER